MSGRWAITCKDCGRRITWEGAMTQPPACVCKQSKQTPVAAAGGEVEEALELGSEIIELVDELPAAGEDFGISVAEKTREIVANIETHQRVTSGQMQALENMRSGLSRWFHD